MDAPLLTTACSPATVLARTGTFVLRKDQAVFRGSVDPPAERGHLGRLGSM